MLNYDQQSIATNTNGGLYYQIGDIKIALFPSEELAIFNDNFVFNKFTPSQPFLYPDIRVQLSDLPAPLPSENALRFTTDTNWSVYYQDNGFLIRLFAGISSQDHCRVLIEPGANSAWMYSCKTPPAGQPFLLRHPIDMLLILYYLIYRKGFIVHAAGAIVNGMGILFPATSGSGKTTLSKLLLPDKRFHLISDERIIVRITDTGLHMYGTPWHGDGLIAENQSAPLSFLMFPSQSTNHALHPISITESLTRLLPTVSVPWYDEDQTDLVLNTVETLCTSIPGYRLDFSLSSGLNHTLIDSIEKHISETDFRL